MNDMRFGSKALAVATVFCLVLLRPGRAAEPHVPIERTVDPWGPCFYGFCMDTHDAKKRTIPQQATMLKEIGFSGAGYPLWVDGSLGKNLKTLDDAGLRVCQLYTTVNLSLDTRPYDPRVLEAFRQLKGRHVTISVLLVGLPPADPKGMKRAVEVLRAFGDCAAENGLRVSIYHHTANWTESFPFALEVAGKVDHPQVGVNFNLCHWLKVEGDRPYEPILRANVDKLFAVTLNGAQRGAEMWTDGLIQPLDRGDFNNPRLLSTLHEIGYRGPIGLMCYGITGDASIHLQRSHKIWKTWTDALEQLEDSKVKGGLVVHVGCRDAEKTAAFRASDRYVVQGLTVDPAQLVSARKLIALRGLYGKVTVSTFDGRHLPYADNLVNLLIGEDLHSVSMQEVLRVLVPGGVAYVKRQGTWQKTVKDWPSEIDQWTHHLHGPDGNPVARDTVVGPPQKMQWQAGPKWSRAHDSDSSTDAVVTGGGRIFYFADEAPASLSGDNELPDRWFLTARDAFNGMPLWKIPIEDWGWRAWKETWYKGRADTYPRNVHRRVVATDDKLYATLGYHAAVSQLDAATGKTLRTYDGTQGTREILYQNGQLILTVPGQDGLGLVVLDPLSGSIIWRTPDKYSGASTERKPAGRITLDSVLNAAVSDELVCFMDGKDLVGLDRETGNERWRTTPQSNSKGLWTGTLITSDGVILYSEPRLLTALSADDGKTLWNLKTSDVQGLWFVWKDVFVIDGLVWTWSPETVRRHPLAANGYDLQTGELKKSMPVGNIFNVDHHHRCYRNKATLNYIIASRRGAEYVDLHNGQHSVNTWVRGICFLGMMPANGLLYAPPHPCKCYINEKLSGFCALAAETAGNGWPVKERLTRASAYGQPLADDSEASVPSLSWPTFRGNPARSGATDAQLPEALSPSWKRALGVEISAPVVAGGRLFVAATDTHTVYALNASSGTIAWTHTGGGPIDSPPTYYRGMVLFGSGDGRVTCLRASDGEVIWTFCAAPRERWVVRSSRIESAWPVHGTVLIDHDIAYVAAGQSSHLDGGIHVYGLQPRTGTELYHTVVEGPHVNLSNEAWHEDVRDAHGLGSLADVMQAVDDRICMGNRVFDRQLEDGGATPPRTRALGGMLDDSQFRRFFWYYGRDMTADLHEHLNYRPIEQLQIRHGLSSMLVNNRESIFGVRRFDNTKLLNPRNFFEPGKGDLLFATSMGQDDRDWSNRIPIRVTSMLVTPKQLVVAGPPEQSVDPDDPLGAYEGRKGGVAWTVSTVTGAQIGEYVLHSPPVFNGLAATNGRLYIALQDGTIECLAGK